MPTTQDSLPAAPAPASTDDVNTWNQLPLSVVVVGASGDLAKRKTYPALLRLFEGKHLPEDVIIWGYARSAKTHQELRDQLRVHLIKTKISENVVDSFLQLCFYQSGKSYGDLVGHGAVKKELDAFERQHHKQKGNRLYYLAVPPGVFSETATAIKALNDDRGDGTWTRVVIEKPFGRDLSSCEKLLNDLNMQLQEESMFRIDHYLGKRVVQDYMTNVAFRADNAWVQRLWHRDAIDCVSITWKEPFGTDGRGGYFDEYGIVRDVIQNHLLQLLSLVAMEVPDNLDSDGNAVRDAKAKVLQSIMPIDPAKDVRLGQFVGYSDDPTISNKETRTPTLAGVHFRVDTERWDGVPFVVVAGKAMDRHVCEVRMRLRSHKPEATARNELVLRLQPDPYVGITTQVGGVTSSMDLKEPTNKESASFANDAYATLLWDVLRGRRASFVRDDELKLAWKLVAPIVDDSIELDVQPYPYGSAQGPEGFADWLATTQNSGSFPPTAAL